MTIPVLETARLLLRPARPDDVRLYIDYYTANREHFARWDPWREASFYTEAYWTAELARVEAAMEGGTLAKYVFLERDGDPRRMVGHASLSGITRGYFQAAYLGYALDHRVEGRGYMHEALTAVMAFAFGELNLHRVMANVIPSNTRSLAVLRRLGFAVEGYARDYLLIAGSWQDHVMHVLTNPHWRPRA